MGNYKTTVKLTYTATVDGTASDVDAVTVQVFKPDGTAVFGSAKTPSSEGSGVYTQEITASETDTIGRWTATWTLTNGTDSHEDHEEFWIDGDIAVVDYIGLCTLEQVKDYPNIDITDDDERIANLIMAATRTICKKYNREFVPFDSDTRTFSMNRRVLDLSPYDLRSVTSIVIHPETSSPTTLTVTDDYILLPVGGEPDTGVFKKIQLSPNVDLTSDFGGDYGFIQIQINGAWGIWATESAIPDDVRWACIQTVLSWLDRQSADIAAVVNVDAREVLPSLGGSWSIPNASHQILQRYERFNGIA